MNGTVNAQFEHIETYEGYQGCDALNVRWKADIDKIGAKKLTYLFFANNSNALVYSLLKDGNQWQLLYDIGRYARFNTAPPMPGLPNIAQGPFPGWGQDILN